MPTFTIDGENNITVFASSKDITGKEDTSLHPIVACVPSEVQ